MLYVFLLGVSILAVLGSGAYLFIYGKVADWRDPVAINAWFGGLSVLLLSLSSLLYLFGHYGIIGSYTPPLALACLGFLTVAGVCIHRASLVWRMARDS